MDPNVNVNQNRREGDVDMEDRDVASRKRLTYDSLPNSSANAADLAATIKVLQIVDI